MEPSNEEPAPIEFSLLENSDDLMPQIGAQMEQLGYLVLMPPAKMASRLRRVRKRSRKFFTGTSPGASPDHFFSLKPLLTDYLSRGEGHDLLRVHEAHRRAERST